jgi:hypothetical protein
MERTLHLKGLLSLSDGNLNEDFPTSMKNSQVSHPWLVENTKSSQHL